MKKLVDIAGYEYDWLLCDCEGKIAFMSTAGVGYAPVTFLENTGDYERAIDEILKLRKSTSAKKYPIVGNGCVNDWKDMAERGVYGYDAGTSEEYYELISAPKSPLFLKDLPKDLSLIIEKAQLTDVSFEHTTEITKSNIINAEMD